MPGRMAPVSNCTVPTRESTSFTVSTAPNLTEQGMLGFLLFFVGINITIGIFNLLPVLPLDGGHIAVVFYEKIRDALRRLRGLAPGGPADV